MNLPHLQITSRVSAAAFLITADSAALSKGDLNLIEDRSYRPLSDQELCWRCILPSIPSVYLNGDLVKELR